MSQKLLFVTEAVTWYSTKDLEGVGTLRWVNNVLYQWVKNVHATLAARAGSPACYDITNYGTASTALGYCTPAPADVDVNFFAGVWVSAVPALSYGWIMVKGRYASAPIAVASGGSGAIGDQYVPTTYTTTTGTGAVRAFAFVVGIDASDTITTATGYTPVLAGNMIAPCVIALKAVATGGSPATDTTPLGHDVFVKGLMA